MYRTRHIDDTLHFVTLCRARLISALFAEESAEALVASGRAQPWASLRDACAPRDTISAVFGRMLLSVGGMTPCHVARVIEAYPTPRALVGALDAHRRVRRAGDGGRWREMAGEIAGR